MPGSRPLVWLLLVVVGLAAAPCGGASALTAGCLRTQPVPVLTCAEIALPSPTAYAHPIRDLTLTVRYTLPDSPHRRTVRAFWDGGTLYRARVALPAPGRWRYRVQASDPQNPLHGQEGTVEVIPYEGTDAFRTRGWLRVADDRRYLTYEDGTPFFWLSDTAWEMAAFSFPEQIEPYFSDRRAKGFTATSIVINSHQYFHPFHIENRLGEPFLLNHDRSLPNPRYFDHLDTIVDSANESGLLAALVPLWGTFAEPHRDTSPHARFYSLDEARTLADYVGARYAGHNVVWIVGGDQRYDTPEKLAYWEAFARHLDEASGGTHLMTVHAGGSSGSYQGWPTAPDWLDVHTYQGSHIADIRYPDQPYGHRIDDEYGSLIADGAFHWQGGLRGFDLLDTTPVLSAESNYEDLFSRFWEVGSDTTRGQRIQSRDVRHAAYWGLLSGSTVGFTYGANGVWQWANTVGQGSFYPRHTVLEALDLPGAAHMTVLRSFAETRAWHTWVPCPELVRETDARHFVPAACGDGFVVLYAPTGTRQVALALEDAPADPINGGWTHAVTGTASPVTFQPSGDRLILTPPDGSDWLLTLVAPEVFPPPSSLRLAAPAQIDHAGANPSRGFPTVRILANPAREAVVEVFDVRGRRLYQTRVTLRAEPVTLTLPLTTAGTYFVRVVYPTSPGAPRLPLLPLTILP